MFKKLFKAVHDNDLIPASQNELAQAAEDSILVVAASTSFLPRLQLCGGSSDLVKEGKVPVAHYVIVRSKDSFEDLGKEVDSLVCAGRSKAIDFSGDKVLQSFDHNSELFKAIAAGSVESDSKKMYGPEYLLFIPKTGDFVTFYLSSATARREAPSIHARLRKAATLKSQLLNNKKGQKWHGPVITPCSTPFDVPTPEEIKSKQDLFYAAKDSDVEVEGETKAEGTEDRVR